VVELNPAQVRAARATLGARRLKSDQRDCAAMIELLVRGGGRPPQVRNDAMAAQAAWVAHRRRKVAARTALGNQLLGTLDLVFPGLDGCFADLLGARAGRLLLTELADPDRIRRLGADGLRRFCARRGVQLRRPKAGQLIAAAQTALRLPAAEHAVRLAMLRADVSLLDALDADVAATEVELAAVLPDTPATVLTSLPGVAVVRASAYGAALGDPARYPDAAAAYRASGLVPCAYESAGRARGRQPISREGSVELRRAILELGRGLGRSEPDFARYRRELTARGKPAGVVAVAVAHRAHRLAFALIRTGETYQADRWAASVASQGERKERKAGGPVSSADRQAASRDDVTRPPEPTVPAATRPDNHPVPV
jgi:transposase